MREQTLLFFKRVDTEEEAELLRLIRNQCREFMTRNTSTITQEQQKAWFKTAYDKYDLYLIYAIEYGVSVTFAGYGVIHKNMSESLVTGGLLPEYRNRGLGQDLFKFLTDESVKRNLPVRLEVLKTNQRAFKVYEKLGYVVTGETYTVYQMEYKYDSVI